MDQVRLVTRPSAKPSQRRVESPGIRCLEVPRKAFTVEYPQERSRLERDVPQESNRKFLSRSLPRLKPVEPEAARSRFG